MSDNNIITEDLWYDFKKNISDKPLIPFFVVGIVCFFFQWLLYKNSGVSSPGDLKDIWGLAYTSLGSTGIGIIGAGIVATLLKTQQFTDIFKKHITEVIYTPGDYQNSSQLTSCWYTISSALLKKVLPKFNELAVDYLKEHYFNNALEYQFDDHKINYIVKWIDPKNKIVQIVARTKSKIIPSQGVLKPKFEYTFQISNTEHSSIEICSFTIGDRDLIKEVKEKQSEQLKTITLTTYLEPSTDYSLDRVTRSKQNLKEENFIKVDLIRYVKDISIRFKFETNFDFPDAPKIRPGFEPLGFNENSAKKFTHKMVFPEQYEWEYKGLLLPNQGFILFLYE